MKQLSYMLHTMFSHAAMESVFYFVIDILSGLVSFSQLILVQAVVDSFIQSRLASGIGQAVLFLFSLKYGIKVTGTSARCVAQCSKRYEKS